MVEEEGKHHIGTRKDPGRSFRRTSYRRILPSCRRTSFPKEPGQGTQGFLRKGRDPQELVESGRDHIRNLEDSHIRIPTHALHLQAVLVVVAVPFVVQLLGSTRARRALIGQELSLLYRIEQ